MSSNSSLGSSRSPSMSMASAHQPQSSRFPLPRLSLLTHSPRIHTHARRERGGKGSDLDSESEQSGSETPKPLPKKHKHANAKSVEKPAGVDSVRRADTVGKADGGFDADGFLSGIDLRAQTAAWERLKSRGSGKRSGRGDGRGRDRGRGRGAPGRSQSGTGEGESAAREGEGHGEGSGGRDDEIQASAPPTVASPRRKTAKQRTAAARLARQRNLAAKRHDADDVHAEDGYGNGNGDRDTEDVRLLDAEPPPPPKPGSQPLPRRESLPTPERAAEPLEPERPRMPLPRRAVVLGDAVLGGTDAPPARSPTRKPLPRVSNLNVNSDRRSYKSSHSTSRREDSTANGVDDSTSSEEDEEEEVDQEEETPLPLQLKIGPPRGVRRHERTDKPLPRSTIVGIVSPTPEAGAQAEADSASNPVEAASIPVPSPRATPSQASRLHAPEGEERSEDPCLSLDFDANMDHDLHHANDGEFQLRSSSPSTQTPTESPTDTQNPLRNPDLSFEVIGGLEAMDIYGEDGDDDVDFDLDALNLAYPDEEAPSPLLPLLPATTITDSTIDTGVASFCNKEILMAFEDPGEEAGNGEDWGEGESESDLLMYLAYPDGGSPGASANTTSLPNSPSRPPPPSSASTSGPASASPAKRKRKGNGWMKRKRSTGQRGHSSRAPPAPVSATENMTYEEWCRSVLSSVTTSRRRCTSSQVSSVLDRHVDPVRRTGSDGEVENSKAPEVVGRREIGVNWERKEAAGEGAASMEAPPSDDQKKPSEPLKIRIKIPSSLSLKSLLPPLPSPRPNDDSPSPSTASTSVVSADVPSSFVPVPAITSTAVFPSSKSPEPEVAAGSPPSPIPTPRHVATPTSTPAPPPSPIPSYSPRIPITTKRLPAACAGPRCMNLLATELGHGWKMCELCRVQARRYQHASKYGDGGQCSRSGSEDSRMSGEVDVAIQEEKEKGGGNGSMGVEKKSVRFADDDEVFVIEPRAERHDETVATEVLRRRQSYSDSNPQFTPHLEPSRAMKRFQTVEKLLEMLDEQMKAFLRARNMWVEWRMWMKEGKWASPDADSGVTVEEQRESPTSKEESGFRTQEIKRVAELITDANEVERPDPDNGGKQANDDLDTSRCCASIQAMGVQPPTTPRICEDIQMDDALNHLDKSLLRITPHPNDPPLLNDLDGSSEDISPSVLKPLSPSPSPLLVSTGPSLPAVLTGTLSPAVECSNPPHTYTLASAFNFDGAFSIVAPFCDANVKHGLKTAGVCARIWGVKEMVENIVGIKFEDGSIAAKGGNGEENRDQGSSLMICDCGCGQSAITMKFRWQSTNDDSMNATSVPPIIPTYATTDTSWPKPDEILPHSTAESPRNNDTKPSIHIIPPSNPSPRPVCINTTQPDTPPKLKPNQHSLAHCPPKRTLNINTRVLRVILTVTILDDPSHPYFPGQQVLVNVVTIC